MSTKSWQRTNKDTFFAHIDLFDGVRSRDTGDTIVYFTGEGHAQDEQWIGKVDISTPEPGYYIALT